MTPKKYQEFIVTFTDIEWDANPKEHGNVDLPTRGSLRISAPSSALAVEWAMSDFSEEHCFNISSCQTKVIDVSFN